MHLDLAGPVLDDQVEALHLAAAELPQLDLDAGRDPRLELRRLPRRARRAAPARRVPRRRRRRTRHRVAAVRHALHRALPRRPGHRPGAVRPHVAARSTPTSLERPLLLVHGLADDNVVAAHTLQLSSALLAGGRAPRGAAAVGRVAHDPAGRSSPRTCSCTNSPSSERNSTSMADTETDDVVAIWRLQSSYADIVNRRAWPELHGVFLPDITIDLDIVTAEPFQLVGPDALGSLRRRVDREVRSLQLRDPQHRRRSRGRRPGEGPHLHDGGPPRDGDRHVAQRPRRLPGPVRQARRPLVDRVPPLPLARPPGPRGRGARPRPEPVGDSPRA